MWWKIKALTLLLAATAVAFVMHDWFGARRDAAQLRDTLFSEKKVIDAATEREDQRGRDLQSALAQIEALKKKTKTPQQAAVQLQQYLPLPSPLAAVSTDVPSRSDRSGNDSAIDSAAFPTKPELKATKPGVPSHVSLLPDADITTLYNYVQDCRECALKIAAANANLVDAKSQLASLTRERDAALAANHYGIWRKVKLNCLWFTLGIGSALAYDRGFPAHAHFR
jgi:hypothetical protein